MSRTERIQLAIEQHLQPSYLSVVDESSNHHVPEDAQTHFKLIIVSPEFTNLSRVARHRLVNQLLSSEFEQGLHALSMHLYTAEEWDKKGDVLSSPSCKDGYKNK